MYYLLITCTRSWQSNVHLRLDEGTLRSRLQADPSEAVCVPLQGRGTVVTGRIESGTVEVGDEIEVVGLAAGQAPRRSVVTGVEMFHRSMSQAQAGDNVGLLLRGIKKTDVYRGQVSIPCSSFCW